MKIEGTTELMFATAVALAQNGKMKSTIHCGGREIFILNMDNTILIRYDSPQEFPAPFSLFANDYESPKIHIQDGKVVFTTAADGVNRTKVCPAPATKYPEVKAIWSSFSPDKSISVLLSRAMVSFLEDGLSHVEISKTAGAPVKLLQRDIYSGTRVEIERASSGALVDMDDDVAVFGPIGIRTTDLVALFTFTDSLTWYIQPGKNWVYIEDNTGRMFGILGTCVYDELGLVEKVEG